MNHKYLKGYYFEKAILHGYRRSWPRSKDTAILIKDIHESVKGELYRNIDDKDLKKLARLHGVPFNYTHKKVEVRLLESDKTVNAILFHPNEDIIEEWLLAEKKYYD